MARLKGSIKIFYTDNPSYGGNELFCGRDGKVLLVFAVDNLGPVDHHAGVAVVESQAMPDFAFVPFNSRLFQRNVVQQDSGCNVRSLQHSQSQRDLPRKKSDSYPGLLPSDQSNAGETLQLRHA